MGRFMIFAQCCSLILFAGMAHGQENAKEGNGASICVHFAEDQKTLNLLLEQGLYHDALIYFDTLQKRYGGCSVELAGELRKLAKARKNIYFYITRGRSIEALSHGAVGIVFTEGLRPGEGLSPKELAAQKLEEEAVELSSFSGDTFGGIKSALKADRKWKQLGNVKKRLENWIFIAKLAADAKSPALAEKLLERVIDHLQSCHPEETKTILSATLRLGLVRSQLGYPAGGEAAVLSFVEKLEGDRGPSPRLASTYRMVAGYYAILGRNKSALSWLDRVIRAEQFTLHPCHADRTQNERDFASSLYRNGFEKKGLDFIDDCIEGKLQSKRQSCLEGASDLLVTKGLLLGENQEYREGERALFRSVSLIEQGADKRLSGLWAREKALTEAYRALFRLKLGKKKEALNTIRATLDDLRARGLGDTFWAISAWEVLVMILQKSGDDKAALEAAARARETIRRCGFEQQPRLAFVLDLEIKSLRNMGKEKEAKELEKRLREMKGENFGVPGKNDGMKKFLPEIKKLLTEPLPKCAAVGRHSIPNP